MFPRSCTTDPRAAARSAKPKRGCPTSRRWASTSLYLPPIHPDRPHASQGPQQRADGGARRSGQPVGDRRRRRAATRRSSPGSARSTTSIASSASPIASGSRSRSTSRSRRRPIIRGCASIRSGSGIGPTARSSTRRTRRRNTRTSTRSISRAPAWRALWDGAARRVPLLDRARRHASSASTTRTPSRSASGNGASPRSSATIRTRSSWRKRSRGRR